VQERFTETGWTLTTVATRAGLSVATVSAIKNGTRGKRPRPTTLRRLACGLDLPEDTLLRLVGHGPATNADAR
jgi:transcriptional regulator with XRE-family HTH domain